MKKKNKEVDPFDAWCEQKDKEKSKVFQKYIDNVPKENRYMNPKCDDFVISCQSFLKKTGFLTPKQIKALESWADYDPYFDPRDYEDDYEDSYSCFEIPRGFIPNFGDPIY